MDAPDFFCANCFKTHEPSMEVFKTFWKFAEQRQYIYIQRLLGEPEPWTNDPILLNNKFTNVFRASDRVSQDLLYQQYLAPNEMDGAEDKILRTLIFRSFNLPETYSLLEQAVGEINMETFDWKKYSDVLDYPRAQGVTMFSGAYIIRSPKGHGHTVKHTALLHLINDMLEDDFPKKALQAPTLGELYELVRKYENFGPFLSYQMAIDLNYLPEFEHDENSFVVPGIGAVRGLKKMFPGIRQPCLASMIRYIKDNQYDLALFAGYNPPVLFGRDLHMIDIQNLFCEVDKYTRVSHPHLSAGKRTARIKHRFHPSGSLEKPFFPPKWGINESVDELFRMIKKEG